MLAEAIARRHRVTTIVRNPTTLSNTMPNMHFQTGDILNPESVASAVAEKM